MKRINLIPRESAPGRGVFTPPAALRSPLVRMITAVALLLFIAGLFSATSIQRYQRQITKEEAIREDLRTQLREKERERELIRGERETLLTRKKSIQEKISFLESVKEERETFSEVLARLTDLVPAEVWIKNLAIEKDSITIAGGASNNQDISRFMANLEESDYFEETGFSYTRKKKSAGRKIFEYELITRLIPGRE